LKTLNLGILAHVDAGKTTLTERLLYAAGVVDAAGSVDQGTTQSDSLALERRRGITIRAAVVAFTVDDVTVNIIDTPGHPDFIAEVDRSLSVLDGAVLVVSAVEGVQAQTVVLMRALQRLSVPTLIFVNKIDRPGADPDRVVAAMRERLTRHAIPMGSARDAGSRSASFAAYARDDQRFLGALVDALADHDDALLAAVVHDPRGAASAGDVHARLAAQTAATQVHPVFFGSAITGAGVSTLMAAFATLLPAAEGDAAGPASGSVFKVERGAAGEKIAYVRMFSGAIRVRQRLRLAAGREATVTAVSVFERGTAVARSDVAAGQIAKIRGLNDVRIGDTIGVGSRASLRPSGAGMFAPPMLETAVVARDPSQQGALHTALAQLAEQDPLIDLRQDDSRQALFVSLYGEVQKEVVQQTIAADFGIDIDSQETTTICIERPAGRGRACERLGHSSNPFLATIGLTVEPGDVDSGVQFRLQTDVTAVPLYVYKTVDAFRNAMHDYITTTLGQGLRGWQVTDCVVTMTDCGYTSPGTTSADFRKLTPLVVMSALDRAGTVVCEPIERFHLDAPADSLAAVLRLLGQLRGLPHSPTISGAWFTLDGDVPATEVHRLRRQLQGPTHGQGVLEARFDRYEPVVGPVPRRPRSDHNPLNRKEYLLHLRRRVRGQTR
jgi:ribosomal protection tetracycline resistance protein